MTSAARGVRPVSHRISSTFVHRHIGQNAAALIAVRRRIRVFQRRMDFEHTADRAVVHELFGILQRCVEAALEGKHQRVWMSLIQLRCKLPIRFE